MPVKKIKIGELIKELVVEAKELEYSELPQQQKTQKFQRIAIKFKNKLHGDKRKKEDNRLALSTARSYLTRARKSVGEFLGLHHRFDAEVTRIIKKFPAYKASISTLMGLSPSETRIAKKSLLDALLNAASLPVQIEMLDFSKKNINAVIKKLAEDNTYFKNHILSMSTDSFSAKNALINMLSHSGEVYGRIKSLSVDHELIVRLSMNDADKDLLSSTAASNLTKKKNTVVYVDYPTYLSNIINILVRDEKTFAGYVTEMAPLVFALCAVTGRRPIEILYTSEFTAKKRHILVFTGQAKKRDESSTENEIYSLVDSAIVITAFKLLRSLPAVQSIISSSLQGEDDDFRSINDRINAKVADALNKYAKHFFIDRRRVFKDTRGIYGRVCYQRWYLNDVKWRTKDEDIFFSELFGHEDTKSQANYKPYKLNNFNPDFEAKPTKNQRWLSLCELDDYMPDLASGDAGVKIHTAVKEIVLEDDRVELSQNAIYLKTKSFRGTIIRYLEAIGALALPGESLTQQFDEYHEENEKNDEHRNNVDTVTVKNITNNKPTKTVAIVSNKIKKTKPHIAAKHLNDDHWEVIVKLGDETKMFDLISSGKIDAMKTGYALFVGEIFIFKVTIPYKKGPFFEDTLYAENENKAKEIAINDAGLDGFRGPYDKIQVKKV
jgi:hypothetical protein